MWNPIRQLHHQKSRAARRGEKMSRAVLEDASRTLKEGDDLLGAGNRFRTRTISNQVA